MKQAVLVLIMFLVVATLCAGITYSYTLNKPSIKLGENYTSVRLDNAQSWGEPGSPDLPWYGIQILLPNGMEASGVEIKRQNPIVYNLTQDIAPIQSQYPFMHSDIAKPTSPNPGIYNSNSVYPECLYNGLLTHFFSGHPIAFTAISPFEYNPHNKKLTFYSSISVDIQYIATQASQKAAELLKTDTKTMQRLQRYVDNINSIQTANTRQSGYNYLIIAAQDKIANWQPLKELQDNKGLNVLIKSIEEISASSTGADTQEKLRNYIIDIYISNPLEYVFLGGDTDVIPHRGMFVNMGQGSESDNDIPADMYYACLDGNWNTDGDTNWGEAAEADLIPELAIGRFCYNNDAEIANFINKIMSYTLTPVENELKSSLFVGEWLWDGPTWGGDYMDEMIGGSSANGYTTIGVPESWNISTLYDRTYGEADAWGPSQIRPLLSNGSNLVNHLGHSNTTYNMRLSNNQVSSTSITNDGANHNYSIVFTQGCYAGSFDNRDTEPGNYTSDCITEKFTSISTAAVAMISHSRYGWGSQGSTDGASQNYHRQYIDAIFGEGIHELGYTLVDSKIDNIPYMTNSPVMYWVDYETNLFGDPSMMIWTETPQIVSANMPTEWMMGMNQLQITTNAPYAEFILKNGETTIYNCIASADGIIYINMFSNLAPGEYTAYVNAPNFYSFNQTITVTAAQMPYIVCTNFAFDDADNLHHTGEEIGINLYAKNVGLLDLSSPASISLSSPSPNIQVLAQAYELNNLAANDSLAIHLHFRVRVSGNYEDGSRAKLVFLSNFASQSSQSIVYLPLNAPHLDVTTYQINNVSQLIMPGDEPGISLTINNSGSGNAQSPYMFVFSDSPHISVYETECYFEPIMHNSSQSFENAIHLSIGNDAPLNEDVSISYILTAENGSTLEGSFVIHLGAIMFAFEQDQQGWGTAGLNTGFTNQWHRSNYRNYTNNGSYSMKFGGPGSSTYSSSGYGALISPVQNVSPGSQLRFYHWMQAENHESNASYAWDGGMVQMKLNNGSWTQITPVGNYPYRIYNNTASPFSANTNVYSGSFDWTEAVFDLGNVSGTAQFRWVFGSDGYVGGEGWYVDDVRITGNSTASEDLVLVPDTMQLFENYPNPFNPSTNIRFSIPSPMHVALEVFNVKGQLVSRIVDCELDHGNHSISWNGKDSSNRSVASGVYYYRLSTPYGNISKKMLLMK